MGFGTDENYTGYISILRKMLIRDELFKTTVEKNVIISDADLKKAEAKSKKALSIIAISNPDSASVFSTYRSLNDGRADFDSVFLAQPENISKKMLVIRYGNIVDEVIEDVVFNTSAGKYSVPLKDGEVWHIFKVLKVETEKGEPKDPLDLAKNRLKERRLKAYGEKYLAGLLGKIRIDLNEEMVKLITLNFKDRLIKLYPAVNPDSVISLGEKEISDQRKKSSSDQLNIPVILFPDNPLTYNDILDHFSFHGFSIKAAEINSIMRKVVRELHKITQDELLVREGLKSVPGVEGKVEKQLEMWRSNALAQLIRNRYLDSVKVTDSELKEYYRRMNSSKEALGKVVVEIIFHAKLDTISSIMDALRSGGDFAGLSKRYVQKRFVTDSLLPYENYKPFTEQLEKGKAGEVIGPLNGDEGFYLFRIIRKKDADSLFLKPFESVKSELNLMLKSGNVEKLLNERTVALASKYSVSINSQMLPGIAGRTLPMYVYRFIGFGGRITAAPFTSPMYQWIKDYQKMNNVNP